MSDSYEEVTTESWGSRLGSSLKGVIAGIVLFVAAIPLLFWNEGRAVKTTQALLEGEEVCVTLPSIEKVDPQYEGKLIHATGDAVTQDVLTDNLFPGISMKAIKLRRKVEYYQWEEEERTREEKEAGGSTRKVTTYSYHKRWVRKPIDSSRFKRGGYHNVVHYHGADDIKQTAANVSFGAFTLTPSQIEQISDEKTLPLKDIKWPQELTGRTAMSGDKLYIGRPTGYYAGMPGATPMQPTATAQTAPVPADKIAQLPKTMSGGTVTVPSIQPTPMNVVQVDGVPFVVLPDGTATPVMPHGVCYNGAMQIITAALPGNGAELPQNPMVQYVNIPNYGSLPVFMMENRLFVRLANGMPVPYIGQTMTGGQIIVNKVPIVVTIGTTATTPPPAYNSSPAVQAVAQPQQQTPQFSTANAASPEIGDVRISWTYVPDTMPISLVSRQVGTSFAPYIAENGYDINLLYTGTHTKQGVFQKAHNENTVITWLIRVGGWFLMFIGLKMVFKPLSVLADVLPIAGDLVETGTGIIAFLISLISALVVIAIAWIFYRPILGISLLVIVAVLLYMLIARKRKASIRVAEKRQQTQAEL